MMDEKEIQVLAKLAGLGVPTLIQLNICYYQRAIGGMPLLGACEETKDLLMVIHSSWVVGVCSKHLNKFTATGWEEL